ncbi:MAG: cytochrome ubiquinol oxidase subunit II [Pseudomonadota bacterium]
MNSKLRWPFFILISIVLLLAGCSEVNDSFLDPKGPVASAQKSHLISITLYTLIAAIPVFILVPIFLWRYRYKNKQSKYTPNWEFSGTLDLLMWGVPFAIIIVLSTQLWHHTKNLDPYKPIDSPLPALEVQVVGMDWKWLFIYPEYGIASVGEMAFPVDRTVSMVLTSDTVMQSFLISSLAGQIYTMPGMQTRLHVKADEPGIFEGQNTQFNGIGFTEQKFNAVAMSNNQFNQWVKTVKAQGIALNKTVYKSLAVRSTTEQVHKTIGNNAMPDNVTYFSKIPLNLYSSIIGRYHTGQPIPLEQQPGGALYKAGNIEPATKPSQAEINPKRATQ